MLCAACKALFPKCCLAEPLGIALGTWHGVSRGTLGFLLPSAGLGQDKGLKTAECHFRGTLPLPGWSLG